MRSSLVCAAAAALIAAGAGAASAQDAARVPADGAHAELLPEDLTAAPFPVGPNAGLVKRVCTECHPASMVLDRKFSYEQAVETYKLMIGENIETDEAKRVIEYLSTVLGRN